MHWIALLLTSACLADAETAQINPVPREVLVEPIHEWTFDDDHQGWIAQNNCRVSAAAGSLVVRCTGDDPFFHQSLDLPGGPLRLTMRIRCQASGPGTVYWTSDRSPHRGEDKASGFRLQHDRQWHEVSVRFPVDGRLSNLRIDPGQTAGSVEIDWMRLVHEQPHPLYIQHVTTTGDRVRLVVRNDGKEPIECDAFGRSHRIGAEATVRIEQPLRGTTPLEKVAIELQAAGLAPVRRTVFAHNVQAEADWIVLPLGEFTLQVAPDGSMARVRRDGQLAAVLAPLMHGQGDVPALKLVERGASVKFQGDGVTLELTTAGDEISVAITSEKPCEGPVVRAVGSLEQGLLAGLEYLGKGERSSTKIDVETAEHLRFAPDPMKLTMPLTAFVTDRASVAMTWSDMQLQPTFATPNFFDGTADHRMALGGTKIDATIRVTRQPLREAILWAVEKQGGLPPLPEPPRTVPEQWRLCLEALNGPLRTEAGWGHCVEDRWARHPHADHASTIWRLTGKVPEFPQFVPGGSHVRNGTIYFVTGRADQWVAQQRRRTESLIRQQKPDGSFRYQGKFARGHFEDTASGVCARPAAELLQYAYVSGDQKAQAAGIRALEFMKRFRTPRGAQLWEIGLHTPDQLASAYLVWAYVRGFELTGNREYLDHARKWALSGIPFTYLWSCQPIMLYATPPVFGATNWRAPCWIGLPVQWVGGVYAYGLTVLAPHDDSLDWNHLARGILISAEQQQFPDGQYVGLLPDSIELRSQERRPWRINPCALVSLRMALDGGVDFLQVATAAGHRVAAPFPVVIRDGQAHIEGVKGLSYQILVDGQVVSIQSQGDDVVPLDTATIES